MGKPRKPREDEAPAQADQTDEGHKTDAVITGVLREGDTEHALVQRFWLQVVEGPDTGKRFASSAERTVVGTHEAADCVLTDGTVSRFHCELMPTEGRALVRDLDSRNGTLVDGVSILAAHLRAGSTLTLGRTKLRFELAGEQVKLPLSSRDRFGGLIGKSPSMRRAFALLEKAAASDATVLLGGESGTGKEAAAEALHRESPRREGPFVVVDCGAIPPDLLESELFGHERGAFTGAVAARTGAFEAAHGGTIFLDEIGELAMDLQPKLLRALERREIKRVGQNKHLAIDVRVIAATNRNLRGEVNTRKFRADLYYRLAVVEISLPPLRERPEDLPILVEHILTASGASKKPEAAMLRTPETAAELARHAWPGNVRELRNYIERCLALREPMPPGDGSDPANLAIEPVVNLAQPLKLARDGWTRRFERQYLEGVLARHEGNVTAAARAADVDRIHFYRLLWKHGLK